MALTLFTGSGGGSTSNEAPYYAPTYFPADYFYGGAGGDSSVILAPTQGPTPYNAPTYFPVSYFYGGATAAVDPTQGPTPYNPPTYFPPSYFYDGSSPAAPPSAVVQRIPGRDGGCYTALVAALEGIKLFDAVIFGEPSSRRAPGADSHPLAIITPRGWEETDDTDPVLDVRRVMFTVRIVIRVENDISPFDRLDRLAAAVQAQIDGADLNRQCLPALTKIRAGRYQASSQYPEWSVDLDGEFAILIDPSAAPVVV